MKQEKNNRPLTPLGIEAWVMLITLLFGLLLLGILHSRTRALETAAQNQQTLAFALMDAAEQCKADPMGAGAFLSGPVTCTFQYGDISLTATIRREVWPGGSLYHIEIQARGPEGEIQTLRTARYLPGEVAP